MRKAVTFRFDGELLQRARHSASADNRTLTNFVETAILRALDGTAMDGASVAASPASGSAEAIHEKE